MVATEAAGVESASGVQDRWEIAGYEVTLFLADDKKGYPAPRLAFKRVADGRRLKSCPKAVREHPGYGRARGARDELKVSLRRMRGELEDFLASGEPVRDLSAYTGTVAGRALLSRLMLRDAAGTLGFPVLEESPVSRSVSRSASDGGVLLRTLSGGPEASPGLLEAQAPLHVAHVHDLYAAGPEVLSGFQRFVVDRRIRQPLKQAFRELYVVTPAEISAGTESARFAGHRVYSQMAVRLLMDRGWENSGDGCSLYKEFSQAGIVAVFEFETRGHFFGGEVTTAGIWFCRDAASGEATGPLYRTSIGPGIRGEILELESVPQPHFSETLRDADLVVSVAQLDDDGGWLSEAGIGQRADLLSALVQGLGLRGVRVEGHFAHVQGQRASYRVHLGSAAVHVDPGNYLCIIPAGYAEERTAEKVFLPFAGETATDRKAREAISKVLLLTNDQAIKDRTILAQLRHLTSHDFTP